MQDELVFRLANALNTQLITAEARRAERVPSPDSMDSYFQGMVWLNKGFNLNDLVRAQTYFERALAIDPDNVDALASNEFADVQPVVSGFAAHERAARFAAAEPAAAKALFLAPDHAGAHSLRLSPRDALLYGWLAIARFAKDYLGRYQEVVTWQRRSIDANPNNPTSHFHLAIARG